MSQKREIIILILILVLAAFFRLWKINSIPPGLYPDEAINGNDALNHPGHIFYAQNNGREGLFINLIFLSFKIFGVKTSSIRITSAIMGILVILGLYLLVKELFYNSSRSSSIALFSSFFAATGFWAVNFSRIGFRGILTPLILVFSLYFLFKALKYGLKKPLLSKNVFLNLLLGGIIFGLGFYGYTVFRLAVLLLVAILFSWWYLYKIKHLQKKFFIIFFCLSLVVFITGLPLGLYFVHHPSYFLSRAIGVSVFSQPHPLKTFSISFYKHLVMFNFRGDGNWRHNIAGSPELFWPVGLLFLLGIVLSIKYLYQSIKNKIYYSFITFTSLLSWFFIMLLPASLTFEGIPHSLRAIGALPPVFIFTGLGLDTIYDSSCRLLKRTIRTRRSYFVITLSLIILLFSFIFSQYYKYFYLWGQSKEVKESFTQHFVDIGHYLNLLPEDINKYVIVNESGVPVPFPSGIPMPAQTVMFIQSTQKKGYNTVYILPKDISSLSLQSGRNIFILMKSDPNLVKELKKRFPYGFLKENTKGIWDYEVDR